MKTIGMRMLAAVAAAGLLAGCTTTEQHAGAGALAGAGIGAIIGNNLGHGSGDRDKGAALGAVVGGLLGHQFGARKEHQQVTDARIQDLEASVNSTTVWVTNSNGSRTPVTLQKAPGGLWVGPRGEYYETFPSARQLKPVYGF